MKTRKSIISPTSAPPQLTERRDALAPPADLVVDLARPLAARRLAQRDKDRAEGGRARDPRGQRPPLLSAPCRAEADAEHEDQRQGGDDAASDGPRRQGTVLIHAASLDQGTAPAPGRHAEVLTNAGYCWGNIAHRSHGTGRLTPENML